jgi:hypothetical protein
MVCISAAQAQSRIKILEKASSFCLMRWFIVVHLGFVQLPELQPPEEDETEKFK